MGLVFIVFFSLLFFFYIFLGPFLFILILNVQVIRAHKESLLWRLASVKVHVQQEAGRAIKGEQHSVTLICVGKSKSQLFSEQHSVTLICVSQSKSQSFSEQHFGTLIYVVQSKS